ncbi:AraC family transcriptional regulator [Thermoactinospora rubra]|uniref:AraC family transcriptional regulator n=1 Tax=Thermoactinospora rubra TaxID=1088767 RepID=UPI000A100EC8|nr:AraC family transcriptional regulator [Thermoactinospora rubra]
MDAFTGLLDGPRARGAFLLRALLDPPWSIRVQDEAPLSVVIMLRGDAWILPDVRLRQGDIAITRGPDAFTFCDDPATPVQIVVDPGQHCRTPDGRPLSEELGLGLRTWGTSVKGSVCMLIGTYQLDSEVSRRLLRTLPPLLISRGVDSPLIALLDQEIDKDEPGQEVVLDRLLDLLVIAVLRGWFAERGDRWYLAFGDPVVGRALRLLHNDPAHPWTVASLAERVGVSRATLARAFTRLVGEPPMSYLTDWRLTLAADLLREPGATVGAVARKVGYATPFALSAAFKRARGLSPQEYRTREKISP